jgi:hypothetical protein
MSFKKYEQYHRMAGNFIKQGNWVSALYWLKRAGAEVTR